MSESVIAVCADDFGYSSGVDRAVLSLLSLGRLSAVSCMSSGPRWRADAPALREQAEGRADLGLHLNLSESFEAEPPVLPLRSLILRAYTARLSSAELRIRIALQLDAFESALGRAPDFVDGHQHVHQLPTVRRVLLSELARRYAGRLPWLRDTTPARDLRAVGFKPRLIAGLGARALHRQAARRGFVQNRGFAGVYDFDGDEADYFHRLLDWLAALAAQGKGGLLMCHPGLEVAAGDPIAAARQREYAVLSGEAFEQALALLGLRLGRLSRP